MTAQEPLTVPPQPPLHPPPKERSVRIAIPTHKVLVAYILLGVNIVIWLAMTFMGGSENTYVLVVFGAKVNALIEAGQYWRLLTAAFLHIGLTHLLFNAYALYNLGPFVESRLGSLRFLVLYLLSGIMGNVFSLVGNDAIAAGASGAIFGLIGAMIAYFLLHRDKFGAQGQRQLKQLLTIAGINLLLGLSPGIDNLAHIGGLLAGLALGWALAPRYQVVQDTPTGPPYIQEQTHNALGLAVVLGISILIVAITWWVVAR